MERIELWTVDGNSGNAPVVRAIEEVLNTETEALLEDLLVQSPDLLVHGLTPVGRQLPTAGGSLDLLGVDQHGLVPSDRDMLDVIVNKFNGGPVGVNTIAAALSEEPNTIEDFNEPYLIQIGMLERTPRGRVATLKAHTHMAEQKKKKK